MRIFAAIQASSLAALAFATGCATTASEAEGSSAAAEVFTGDLWAGQTSLTMERYIADPCGNPTRVDRDAIGYESWARERASVKNVCFEVWKPGVTDRENPDFWRELDVQVHYRLAGESDFKTEYVNSVDRRGNNRRYAWKLDVSLDPLARASSLATLKVPFTLVSESGNPSTGENWASVRSTMEFYFTVNGKVLNTSDNQSYRVDYSGTVRTNIRHTTNPSVLYEDVKCDGASFGSGAGYNAVDITDTAAIDEIAAGLDGSLIYGAGMNVAGTGASRALSINLGGSIVYDTPREILPHFTDGAYSAANVEAVPRGDVMTLKLAVYDRAAKKTRVIERAFASCVKVTRP